MVTGLNPVRSANFYNNLNQIVRCQMTISQEELANIVVKLGIVEAIKQGFIQAGGGGDGEGTTVTSDDITDATTLGKELLKATNAAAARAAIGAGTGSSNLTVGSTATTAKAGNWLPTVEDLSDATTTGKTLLKVANAAAARTAIGAGTSNLALGTTSSTAKAGNWMPTSDDITDATALGKSILTAEDQDSVRSLLGIPMGQGVGNATDEATAVTQLNALLTQLRNSGIIQPSA